MIGPALQNSPDNISLGTKGGVLKIDLVGIYTVVEHTAKIGFLSPLYRKVGEGGDELFLYSHHHEGRMWLIGRGYDRWNIRLDLVEIIDRQKPAQRYTRQTLAEPRTAFNRVRISLSEGSVPTRTRPATTGST